MDKGNCINHIPISKSDKVFLVLGSRSTGESLIEPLTVLYYKHLSNTKCKPGRTVCYNSAIGKCVLFVKNNHEVDFRPLIT